MIGSFFGGGGDHMIVQEGRYAFREERVVSAITYVKIRVTAQPPCGKVSKIEHIENS